MGPESGPKIGTGFRSQNGTGNFTDKLQILNILGPDSGFDRQQIWTFLGRTPVLIGSEFVANDRRQRFGKRNFFVDFVALYGSNLLQWKNASPRNVGSPPKTSPVFQSRIYDRLRVRRDGPKKRSISSAAGSNYPRIRHASSETASRELAHLPNIFMQFI